MKAILLSLSVLALATSSVTAAPAARTEKVEYGVKRMQQNMSTARSEGARNAGARIQQLEQEIEQLVKELGTLKAEHARASVNYPSGNSESRNMRRPAQARMQAQDSRAQRANASY